MQSGSDASRNIRHLDRQAGTRPGPRAHKSRKTRLAAQAEKSWDNKSNFYFITLFTQHRKALFGEVQESDMSLNSSGEVLQACWYELPVIFSRLLLDLFIIMPNHLHALLALPLAAKSPEPDKILNVVIGEFIRLSAETLVNASESQVPDIWRSDFQQTQVQSEAELNLLRDYIVDNPAHWDADPLNPQPKSRILLHPPLGKPPQT